MKKSSRAIQSVLIMLAVVFSAMCLMAGCKELPQFADASAATAAINAAAPTAAPTTAPTPAPAATASASAPSASAADDEKLEKAVSAAVVGKQWDDLFCELKAEGHVILGTEKDKSGNTVVYVIASYVAFGFENNIFTVTSGSGAIPAVIVFSESAGGDYTLISYQEPSDGDRYTDSIHQLFPERFWEAAANTDKVYPDLVKQQENQAKAYLESIGRDSEVHAGYVEKERFRISVGASNTLIGITGNSEYPFWIGTRESIEGGVRYIYEASEEDSQDDSIITFTKKTEDGNIVKQLKYKITGDTVELMQ